jgi:hypothetical protein
MKVEALKVCDPAAPLIICGAQDVLVIGRSPQSGVSGRLRDLSYAVVRDAPCPVLSV